METTCTHNQTIQTDSSVSLVHLFLKIANNPKKFQNGHPK